MKNEQYEIISSCIVIHDEEMGISFHDKEPLPLFDSTSTPPHGRVKKLDKKNNIIWEGYYVDGILHGPSRWFFSQDTLASISWYIHGLKEGKNYSYYKSGAIQSIRRFIHGLKEGSHKYYYPDGKLKADLIFSNDKLTGPAKFYYPDGKPMRTIFLKDGKRNGLDVLYDAGEKTHFALEYLMGKYVKAVVKDPLEC